MLRVGLTGGIGAGKSTVASRLAEHGAVVIDSDLLAREVVAPGTDGLAAVVAAFGDGVLAADRTHDRPADARIVFGDQDALATLNGIVHPRVRARAEELVAAAPPHAVLVNDVPLLVENGMAAAFHLVVIVDAPVATRVARLVGRGLAEADARARIAAQASDEQRRAAADVWLDNGGLPERVQAAVDELWADRLVPFEANVRLRRPERWQPVLVEPDPTWPEQARRLIARIALATGGRRVDHIGSTAVPGLPAKDVVDLQLTVASMAEADELADALADAGFPRLQGVDADNPKPPQDDPSRWHKRLHQSADPGRLVNLHVRVDGSPAWRYALLVRDWLLADADARAGYLAVKRRAAEVGAVDRVAYNDAKEPWFDAAWDLAQRWATSTGWTPPPTA